MSMRMQVLLWNLFSNGKKGIYKNDSARVKVEEKTTPNQDNYLTLFLDKSCFHCYPRKSPKKEQKNIPKTLHSAEKKIICMHLLTNAIKLIRRAARPVSRTRNRTHLYFKAFDLRLTRSPYLYYLMLWQ